MILSNLNDAQCKFITKWLTKHQKRPSFGVYEKAQRDIKKINIAAKPPANIIQSTKQGAFGNDEVVPSARFNARKHLPPGWAVVNVHDSNGSHRLYNAGEAMLTALWNHWAGAPDEPFSLRGGMVGKRLQKQLAANNINLPEPQ